MDLTRAPYEFAGAAADEIRALNYRTLNGGYHTPGDVYDVAHALKTLAQRLPQALEQLSIGFAALADGDHLRITSGAPDHDSVPERSRQISAALNAGLEAVGVLEESLAVVSRLTSDLV